MWCAVGKCLSRLSSSGGSSGADGGLWSYQQQREGALLAYERAVQCDDREGVATRELARMHRDMGDSPSAASCYKSFLDIQDLILQGSTSGSIIPAEELNGLGIPDAADFDPSRLRAGNNINIIVLYTNIFHNFIILMSFSSSH